MSKNVGFIIPSLRNGGAERVLSTISTNLDKGINQYICVWDSKNPDFDYNGQINDIEVQNKNTVIQNMGVLLKRVNKVKKFKKKNNINSTISFLEGPNLVNIFSRRKDKVIISVHNFQSKERKGIYGTIFKSLMKKFYNNADIIVAVSKMIKVDLINNFNVNENKVKVIYNPYDIPRIEEMMDEKLEDEYIELFKHPIIINVGRLTEQKGQWHLIKSFYEVKQNIKDAKLVILGQGELEEELVKLIKELNLQNDVILLGFHKNPYKFIKNADVFALTSLYEGFPMCLAESMVCGTPIVSVDCKSGPREMLNPNDDITKESKGIEYCENGILVKAFEINQNLKEEIISKNISDNEKIFAEALINVLNNKELRTKYEIAGKNRVRDFDVNKIIEEWHKLI